MFMAFGLNGRTRDLYCGRSSGDCGFGEFGPNAVGYVSLDEYEVQFAEIFEQITAFAAGTPINVVNPDVLSANSL
jgi:hypothetical protein